ncbi:solute carrier organic anion transporter family member 74D-like [Dermacentor andersoni]|uniref:solute carrier organic anion transporter family member 74D-like n=1 Tax=Dermacentor andersoni TaxID=34620 RepID=UPI002155628E|nr:solute carrier organic anion transporter family member 74D-like [Dermacentor andersoni]
MTSGDEAETRPMRTHVRDFQCGLGSWRPKWLQTFASPRCLFFFLNLLAMCQSAYKAYTMGSLSTLERRFSLSSKSIAIILVAESISPIFFDIPLGYVASWISRPKLLSLGMMVVGCSSLAVALPYVIFGPATHLLADEGERRQPADFASLEFCGAAGGGGGLTVSPDCTTQIAESYLPFIILFVASFLNGFGQSVLHVAGSSYIDDSVKKKSSPLYFGASFALRSIGPALGFLGASLSLSFYEDPFLSPDIPTTDPRWIGCWWLGYVFWGCLLLLASVPVLLFPKVMPARLPDPPLVFKKRADSSHLSEIGKSLSRLLRKRVYVLQLFVSMLMVSGLQGYTMFSAKYMEVQFRNSAARASAFAGLVSSVFNTASFLVSGLLIHRLRPAPRVLAWYNVVVIFAVSCGFAVAMLIKCEYGTMPGVSLVQGKLDLYNQCNDQCDCTLQSYQPVCEPVGGTVYFSPCFAGCQMPAGEFGANLTKLTNCDCLKTFDDSDFFSGNAVVGFCKGTCPMFVQFIIIVSLVQFMGMSTSVSHTLFMLRSISPSDKTIALGLANALANLLSYIPYPLIYGAVIDGSCQVWESACGTSGNCWLYDLGRLRHSYLGTSAGFLFMSGLFSIAVAAVAGDLKDFYGETYLQVPNFGAPECEPPRNGVTKQKKADVKRGPKGLIRN